MNKPVKIFSGWVGVPATVIAICVGAGILIVTSCSTTNQGSAGASPAGTGKSGTQLWADNCQRCHNTRSPSSYNDVQWEVAMMHMRVRANLTPEEHKKILEFLKQGK